MERSGGACYRCVPVGQVFGGILREMARVLCGEAESVKNRREHHIVALHPFEPGAGHPRGRHGIPWADVQVTGGIGGAWSARNYLGLSWSIIGVVKTIVPPSVFATWVRSLQVYRWEYLVGSGIGYLRIIV